MRRMTILAFLLVTANLARAQSGQTSFDFLLIGPSSRASAMGEAATALGGDAGAPYFNPALAAIKENTEFSFMHVAYLTDVTMDHFMVTSHSRKFHYGLGLYYGKVSDLQRRDATPTDQPLGTFDEHNFTASFFWALPVTERIYVGNSVKWAYEKIDLSSASALGLDFGAYYSLNPQIAFGLSVRNLGTEPKFDSTAFSQPRELRLGASYDVIPGGSTNALTLAADYILPKWGNDKIKFAVGAEYTYQKFFSLRAGYDFGYDTRNFSIGGGIMYTNYFFDYAFVPSKNNLNDTHRFTFRIRL